MTDTSIKSYFLSFTGFSIEFRLDKKLSVDFTDRFDHHGPDFVFAVVEIWLHLKGSKQIIISATYPENFLERLRDMSARVSNPPTVPGIEEIIPCGEWCSWMAGYWERVDKEIDTIDDEKMYDLLISLSFVESKSGHIALYLYGGSKIFEVATRSDEYERRHTVGAWSQFNSDALRDEIAYLEKAIVADIRGMMKRQP